MIKYKQLIVLLCSLSFLGCSSDQYQQAKQSYLQAKSTHQINQLITALTDLAKIAPEEYAAHLFKANQAKIKLLEAQKHIKQNDYYLAYLASHDSLQQMYSIESKKILRKSGTALLPLLKAKESIDKSYQHHPLALASLSRYKELPTLDWDLLALNKLLNQLSENILLLETSTNIIKTVNSPALNSLSSELLLIELRIENRLQRFTMAQNYLIGLALHRNAKLLTKLNNKLAGESLTISQVFNKKRENKALLPFIESSQNRYAASKKVIENIFYASASKSRSRHLAWFKKWRSLEKDILEPTGDILDYSLSSESRNEQLMEYVSEKKSRLPELETKRINLKNLFHENKVISALVKKLAKDKRFFTS